MQNMSPEQLALLATSIAIDLGKNKSIEELNLLLTLLNQIESAICTMIAQQKFLIDRNCEKFPKC